MADGSDYIRAVDLASVLTEGKSLEHVTGLQSDFASRLTALLSSAPPDIRNGLGIYSGYRSPERQAELFNAAVKKYGSVSAARKWVAPPGSSFHGKGLATDLSYKGQSLARAPQNVVTWAHENAPKFGLYFPLGHENWHIEPIGTRPNAATQIQAVKKLQTYLNSQGAALETDGIWGQQTEAAFQKLNPGRNVYPAASFERDPRARALAASNMQYGSLALDPTAPPAARPVTTATQSPSAIQQIASWLSNISEGAANPSPVPPAYVQQPLGPTATASSASEIAARTPAFVPRGAPVAPVTRASLPGLSTSMRGDAQAAIDTARRPAAPRASAASIDRAFDDLNAKRSPSFFYSAENAPKPINPFSWDIGRGNNLAAAAPRPTPGDFPSISQPVAGNRTTINNVSGSGRVPAIGAAMSATRATAGMMGKGILNGLTNMGQAAGNAATSWRNVLNPAYTAAQQALARAQAANPGGASTLVPSTGKPGELGTPIARTMGSIAKLQAELDKTPKFIRTAAPATPAPARLPVTVVRTLPQVTPAVTPPSGGGNGNSSGNPFTAAGMQRVGTAPSGAALYSSGNGQVFTGNAPSNLFGGMGFGGGGGSFRGVNNY
jgi:hypothetical protein